MLRTYRQQLVLSFHFAENTMVKHYAAFIYHLLFTIDAKHTGDTRLQRKGLSCIVTLFFLSLYIYWLNESGNRTTEHKYQLIREGTERVLLNIEHGTRINWRIDWLYIDQTTDLSWRFEEIIQILIYLTCGTKLLDTQQSCKTNRTLKNVDNNDSSISSFEIHKYQQQLTDLYEETVQLIELYIDI